MVVGCWLLVVGCWLLVVGCWLLVVGCCWLLVVGCWLFVVCCLYHYPLNGPIGGGGCFSFGGTVQCIEESNIYLCFVVCRLKKREDWLLDRICESKKDCWDSIRRTSYPYQKVER